MSTEKQNHNLEAKKVPEMSLEQKKEALSSLKESIGKGNEFMSSIDKLEKNSNWKEKNVNKGEYLFKEGQVDKNLYIVKSGTLSVEKFTNNTNEKAKVITTLGMGEIIGEQAINSPDKEKATSIKAVTESTLLSIDAGLGMMSFLKESPELAMIVLKEIIGKGNERLNNLNEELTYVFEFNDKLKDLSELDNTSLQHLFGEINKMIPSDYIILLKTHEVVKDTYVCKYDSRKGNKIPNIIIEKENGVLDLKEAFNELDIKEEDSIVINKITIGDDELGYMICGRERRSYNDNQKKILKSFTPGIASIIKELDRRKEEKDKISMTSNF